MGMEFVLSYLTEGVWEDCAADICYLLIRLNDVESGDD